MSIPYVYLGGFYFFKCFQIYHGARILTRLGVRWYQFIVPSGTLLRIKGDIIDIYAGTTNVNRDFKVYGYPNSKGVPEHSFNLDSGNNVDWRPLPSN